MGQAAEEIVGPRLVCHGIKPHLNELLLQMGIPEILNFIVRPAREVRCNCGPSTCGQNYWISNA